MAADLVDTVLDAAHALVAAFLENVLVQNKAEMIADAKKIESSAIVAVGATLAKESTTPFFALLEPHIAAAIEASEGVIIAALGGEDEAIFALLEHETAQL